MDGETYLKGIDLIRSENYEVLDYCSNTYNGHKNDLCLDINKDFYDAEHVNIFGAEKLTRDLAAYISSCLQAPKEERNPVAGWEEAAAQNRLVFERAKELTQKRMNQGLYTQRDFLNQP